MAIDDKLAKVLDDYESEIVATPGNLVIEAALNAVPYVGSSIAALLAGKAQERVRQRVADVFTAMKEKLDSVEEGSVRKEFFESEDFQTLLALAIEQLQTSHDKGKISLLAKALVNSGLRQFDGEERKEVFVRALRDLTPTHISIMAELLPQPILGMVGEYFKVKPQQHMYDPTAKLLLQYLVAIGFVEEIVEVLDVFHRAARTGQRLTIEEALYAINETVSKLPEKKYRLTDVGTDFLAFLDIGPETNSQAQADRT